MIHKQLSLIEHCHLVVWTMITLPSSNTTFGSLFQFSLLNKRENAHSEGIWACAWGHFVPEDKSKEKSSEEKEENKENEGTQNEEDKNVPEMWVL